MANPDFLRIMRKIMMKEIYFILDGKENMFKIIWDYSIKSLKEDNIGQIKLYPMKNIGQESKQSWHASTIASKFVRKYSIRYIKIDFN